MLLLIVARRRWHWATWQLIAAGVVFGGVELTFFGGEPDQGRHGGWLPLLIASTVFLLMTTWRKGREITSAERRRAGGRSPTSSRRCAAPDHPGVGTGVFPHPTKETTPLALRANVEHNHVLHKHVLIVSARPEGVPHVDRRRGSASTTSATPTTGSSTSPSGTASSTPPTSPPRSHRATADGLISSEVDAGEASYFLSRGALRRTDAPGMQRWRKQLFVVLAHNAGDPAEFFGLPRNRTVIMGSDVDV